MCEPATLSLIATGVSTAVSTVGAFQQASAQKDQAEYQADVSRANAEQERLNGIAARRDGAFQSNMQRNKVDQLIATQQASFGASSIDSQSGSAVDVLNDTATFGELDAQTIQRNADSRAQGFDISSDNFTSQAGAYDAQADAINPAFEAGPSLITGAVSVADGWRQYDAASLPSNTYEQDGALPWQKRGTANPEGVYF